MAAFKIDSYRVNFLCFSWLDICQQDSSLLILGESTRLKSKQWRVSFGGSGEEVDESVRVCEENDGSRKKEKK